VHQSRGPVAGGPWWTPGGGGQGVAGRHFWVPNLAARGPKGGGLLEDSHHKVVWWWGAHDLAGDETIKRWRNKLQ
jgi:hypothetical protein